MSYQFSDRGLQGEMHIPEGVRDIYGESCKRKLRIEEMIHSLFHLYGFKDIETPAFEFFDVFGKERGTVPSKELYKFFDRDGNTLVLRPDITPSIARCVAKYYHDEELPIRLCYQGNTFINYLSYRGKLKEVTQLGVELVNDSSSDADAEIVALTVECLLAVGLSEFQVEIGHAGFYHGLVEEAGFNGEEALQFKCLMESKNIFGVEEMVDKKDINNSLKELLIKLPDLFGTADILSFARERTKNAKAIEALDRMEKVYSILKNYGLEKYITFDLGKMNQYRYYTGIIFKAYTYGSGEPVVSGGRYDSLLSQYHKNAPAIGMAILSDQLLMTLERQKVSEENEKGAMLLYHSECRKKAILLAGEIRKSNRQIELIRKSSRWDIKYYIEHAKKEQIDTIFYMENENSINVKSVDDGNTSESTMTELIDILKTADGNLIINIV